MQILLFILKVIGIILLILLGLIMLVLALVLFVPIRYEISGEIEDEHKIEAGGVIRYLFSILKIVISYRNGETETDIYLLGFRRKKKVLEESESSYLDEDIEDEDIEDDDVQTDEEITEDLEERALDSGETIKSEETTVEPKTEEKTKIKKDKKAKTDKFKIKSNKKTKKEEKKNSFEFIKAELTDEHNHNVIKKAFRELKYLLCHFRFRKIKTDLVFGAGDPALTGQILGILSVFPMLYRYEFGIIPDFKTENAYIKGTFSIKGRIRLIHVLMTGCRLILDKEVRMVVKKFKDMGNQ